MSNQNTAQSLATLSINNTIKYIISEVLLELEETPEVGADDGVLLFRVNMTHYSHLFSSSLSRYLAQSGPLLARSFVWYSIYTISQFLSVSFVTGCAGVLIGSEGKLSTLYILYRPGLVQYLSQNINIVTNHGLQRILFLIHQLNVLLKLKALKNKKNTHQRTFKCKIS